MITPSQQLLDANRAINEMIRSEETYLNHIIVLFNCLDDELIENISVLKNYKPYLRKLINISEQLLKNIRSSLVQGNDSEQLNLLRSERTQILVSFFEIYPEVNHWYGMFAEKSKQRPDKFQEITDYVAKNTSDGQNLMSYLVMPVQRGMRYKLLIEAALAHNHKLAADDPVKLNEEQVKAFVAHLEQIQNALTEANARPAPQLRQRPSWWSNAISGVSNVLPENYQFGDFTRTGLNWMYTLGSAAAPQLEAPVDGNESSNVQCLRKQ